MTVPAFIPQYFLAEKYEALLFIAAGAAAIGLAIVLQRRRSSLRGMVIPLVAIALIQLVVGATVVWRSDAQIAQLQQLHRQDRAEFRAAEAPRMKTVIANFERYKTIEMGLLALGMAIVVLLRKREFWFAFGLGLVLQAGFMLVLDHFAQTRAHDYFKAVLGT